jgi:hypothetical protein
VKIENLKQSVLTSTIKSSTGSVLMYCFEDDSNSTILSVYESVASAAATVQSTFLTTIISLKIKMENQNEEIQIAKITVPKA